MGKTQVEVRLCYTRLKAKHNSCQTGQFQAALFLTSPSPMPSKFVNIVKKHYYTICSSLNSIFDLLLQIENGASIALHL